MKLIYSTIRWLMVTWVLVTCIFKMADANRKYPLEVHQMFKERMSNGRQASSGGGSWTSWSSWTTCSRTCGGGVATQTRVCQHRIDGRRRRRLASVTAPDAVTTSLAKSHCIGVYKRFHVCNQQTCPAGTKDFRQLQCEMFNRKQFMGRIYFWEPFLDGANPCELNCRPVGFRFYATLNKTVVDGTDCRGADPTRRWMCVQGQCKHVGCDGVVGSAEREDACGVCGGDNSACRLVSGLFTRPTLPVGYNLIAQIPRGACNITVAELKQSKNYLALKRRDGSYVINGDWAINWSGEYDALGTKFSYKRQDALVGESITAPGPLNEPVDLMVIYQQPNTGIKYEYMLPMRPDGVIAPPLLGPVIAPPLVLPPAGFLPDDGLANDKLPLDPTDSKRVGDNALYPYGVLGTEGQGQGRRVNAPGADDLQQKPPSRTTRPKKRKFAWRISEYTKCTKTCGGGVQMSVVVCVREHNNQAVSSKRCNGLDKPQPQSVRCNVKPCLAEWVGGEWGPCSVSCGSGLQSRDIWCKQQITSALTMKVAEGACLSPLTLSKTQLCTQTNCPAMSSNKWQAGPWGQCSSACGEGTRTRTVQCLSQQLTECPTSEKPSLQESCQAAQACTADNRGSSTWLFTEWTAHCSEGCGTGVQTRRVACSGICDQSTRPDESRACSSDKQCSGKWFAGPWGHCSARCGPGRESRNVVCVSYLRGQHRVAPDISCGSATKPDLERSCEVRSCSHEWFTTDWTQCSKDCGSGMQWRDVKCLNEKAQVSDECSETHEPTGRRTCNSHHCHSDPQKSHSESQKSHSESQKSHSESHKSHLESHSHHKSHPDTLSRFNEPVVISVGDQAQPGPNDDDGDECQDKFPNCHLVVQSRLCRYKYYRNSCCVSCENKP